MQNSYFRPVRRATRFSTVDLVLRDAVRSLWDETAAPDPPVRVWRDWALVGVLAPIAVLEFALAKDLVWPVVSLAVALGLLPTLLWRRTHPLAAVVTTFGTFAVVDLVALSLGVEWEGLGTNVYALLLIYSLFRWASGRHAVFGMAVVSIPLFMSASDPAADPTTAQIPAGNVVLGGLVLLVAATIGASVRYQDTARSRGLEEMKLHEREQLARELHDTVAHHVSAIAVRAQAGRVVGPTDPSAALDALAVIEEEASRTLAEMRAMVGALRLGDAADLAPQRGVADLVRLASVPAERPRVHIELSGDLDGLRPSVDAALYRLAQESITNALRHARHATRVSVRVCGDDDCVRVEVSDDGDPASFDPRSATGFGLIGMAERAKLLGGTLEAGPAAPRGWTVQAVLPRGSGGS